MDEIEHLWAEHDKLDKQMKAMIKNENDIWEIQFGEKYSQFRDLRTQKGVCIQKIHDYYEKHPLSEIIKNLREENNKIIEHIRNEGN